MAVGATRWILAEAEHPNRRRWHLRALAIIFAPSLLLIGIASVRIWGWFVGVAVLVACAAGFYGWVRGLDRPVAIRIADMELEYRTPGFHGAMWTFRIPRNKIRLEAREPAGWGAVQTAEPDRFGFLSPNQFAAAKAAFPDRVRGGTQSK